MSKDIHVLETAVDRAVYECIHEGILRDFLLANKAEVKRRSIYEYDEEAICIRMFHMDKKNFMLRLFIILFTISVSTTIIPCGIVNIHGLFGELKSSAVTEESRPLIEETEKQIFAKENRVKGTNIFNAGLYIVIIILCLIFRLYTKSLPPENTIVTFKVRMNN